MTLVYAFDLPNEATSQDFAGKLAAYIKPPLLLTFSGEIGAGKTTFIRAMLQAFGVQSAIKSPTFSLVESYLIEPIQLHHFDLYRLHDESELEYIGFRDYFSQDAICCIEWPERAISTLEKADIHFAFEIKGRGRLLTITAFSDLGEKILSRLAG